MTSEWPGELSEEEMSRYSLDSGVLRDIEAYRASTKLEKHALRILDWGCGRGRSVLFLRRSGYSAFGFDPDRNALAQGRAVFEADGLDPDELLRAPNEMGQTTFPSDFFHFVFSETVIEHVRDLDGMAAELARITARGGMGMHYYPAHRSIIEGHVHLPFVHWVPKNDLRYWLIVAMLLLPDSWHRWFRGDKPGWTWNERQTVRGLAKELHRWTVEQTFYRSCPEIRTVFRRHGFRVDFASYDLFPALRRKRHLAWTVNNAFTPKLANSLFRVFMSVRLRLRRPYTGQLTSAGQTSRPSSVGTL